MKRKLIDYDVFHKIKTESLSSAQQELEASSALLAHTLELESLELGSFGPTEALFESIDGTHVRADYQIKNGYVQFDNVEQLVINEESEAERARETISKMIDSLIESDNAKADEMFAEWMGMPRNKRMLTEAKEKRVVCRKGKKCKVVKWDNVAKHHELSSLTSRRVKGKKKSMRTTPSGIKNVNKMARLKLNKAIGKSMKEWALMAENVLDYVNLVENGPVVDQCQVLRKDGEVVAVRIPTVKLKNEARVLKFDWKTLNTDVVVKRGQSKKISENQEFAKDIAELKRVNAMSDSKAVEESIENVSTKFPQAIYLTEKELAKQIKLSLESVNASNYDDETCRFLAEGILRTIHENFVDTVAKIVKLAGATINEEAADKYAEFKAVAEGFYANLDETTTLEMQAFVDVYEALRQVHEIAVKENNIEVATEAASHLDGLLPIVRNEAEQSSDTLAEAAEWLYDILEGAMGEEWNVSEPVVTVGNHPDVDKKGKASQSPADMTGVKCDAQCASDGKEYTGAAAKELANDGWSNLGGEGVYPSLDNPYVPKAGDYKILGEKDVDSDSEQLAQWGDGDTWPGLQNPYSKASVTPTEAK